MGQLAKVVRYRHGCAIHQWGGEIGELGLTQRQRDAATLGDLNGIAQRARHIRKQRLHLLRGLEVLFPREATHPAAVSQHFTFSNTNAGFVALEIIRPQELNGVRGHHG